MAEETREPPDGPPEPEATQVFDDLEQLRAKAEERDKFLEMLQRTRADFDNYQKRMHRDLEQERRYQLAPLAKDLLPALDNLERALEASPGDSALTRGVKMVQSQLLETLKRHGITRIEATGRPFDPHLHEAVMQQPSGQPAGTVLQALEQGYQYHDRVLRPAKVIVSASARVQAERHANLRVCVRRLRASVRGVSGHQRQAAGEMPEVQEEEAQAADRQRGWVDLQGLRLLHHRLSQRLLQVGREGG